MIKSIIYDLGDIIYDASKWRKWLYSYFIKNKITSQSYKDVFTVWEHDFLIKSYTSQHCSYQDVFIEFLNSLGLKISLKSRFLEECWKKKAYYENNIVAFPFVPETLATLKQKNVSNYILTDNERGADNIKEQLLKKMTVLDSIDEVYSSVDIGFSKPNPKAYLSVLNANHLSAHETYFVGHEKEELDGAKSCNIKTIAYNYDDDVEADYKINHFNEILNTL